MFSTRIYTRLGALALWAALGAGGGAFAQISPNNTNPNVPTNPDGTPIDTTNLPRRDTLPPVERVTLRIVHHPLAFGVWDTDSIRPNVEDFHRWDEADTLPGFVLHTGQVGKPYRQLRHGIADRYWHSPLARDPMDGHTNVYFLDPQTQLRHYDTRTPYVDASFAQNSKDMQLLDVQISQNATPRWNFSAQYHRRTAQGAYLNNQTDNLNAAIGSLWRSRRGRIWNRTAVAFNQMSEQLNGGVRVGQGFDYEQDVFEKRAQPVMFSTAGLWGRVQRTAFTEAGFFAVNDSAFRLGAVAGARYDSYTRLWNDRRNNITPTGLVSEPYPGLQPGDTLNGLQQYAYVTQNQAWAGAVLNVVLGPGFEIYNRVQFGLDSRRAINNSPVTATDWNRRTLAAESRLGLGRRVFRLDAALRLEQTTSDLMAPEFILNGNATLCFRIQEFNLLDSTVIDTADRFTRRVVRQPLPYSGKYAPVALDYGIRIASLNPGWVQTQWQGPTFTGNPGLVNEGLYYTEAGARYTGAPGISQGLPLLPNTARVGVGVARLSRPIFYYGPQLWVLQTEAGQAVSYPFATAEVRWRVWRIYFENRTEATLPTRTPNAPAYLAAQVPQVQGTARLFLRQMLFRRNLQLYMAIECRYHTGFQALKMDPVTAELYPLDDYSATPYARLDAVVGAKIKSAQVFVKLIHLNEGIWQPGYYTVLFHPMLERGFSFGVRWQLWE